MSIILAVHSELLEYLFVLADHLETLIRSSRPQLCWNNTFLSSPSFVVHCKSKHPIDPLVIHQIPNAIAPFLCQLLPTCISVGEKWSRSSRTRKLGEDCGDPLSIVRPLLPALHRRCFLRGQSLEPRVPPVNSIDVAKILVLSPCFSSLSASKCDFTIRAP